MKKEIIKTKRSKLILQVYHNYFLYHKDMKSFSDRKELTAWMPEIHSKSAYLKERKLILSKSDYKRDIHNANLIILNDFNDESEIEAFKKQNQRWQKNLIDFEGIWPKLKRVQYFNLVERQIKFDIFQLKKVGEKIELHLLYDRFEIGIPQRENFKLCNLEMSTPVEIKINGKLDHSFTSGRERSYKEHGYIFHIIGTANEFELENEPFNGSTKQIPKPLKTVDLMKELY